ncbi:MAG: phosphoribosylaminoimidazolesuccinocarboxamide synthase [Sedimentisphaerales bacterium]|nr:phosphoribosylaminoimidazolesuccinocarboxamide synthase [Sedimentisphaerales bacterium]MBN2842781.1 phosphoribosylaminoimidazolesuccinocarboxamide synthase [Sedimentisphaerales bacterium]
MASSKVILNTEIPGFVAKRGKVRDIFDLGDKLLFVASDRISAFDVVMANGVPDKGAVLARISLFWFDFLKDTVKNHLITADVSKFPAPFNNYADQLAGRSMLVKKTKVLPVECIVRGYITGSGWKEYQKKGTVCDIVLPQGLKQCDKLPQALFTPSTKAEQGLHDENISPEKAVEIIGKEAADFVAAKSIEIYNKAADYAAQRGIILADTKFEWGYDGNDIILIDEVLTPDSSRFWPADKYESGRDQESYDKQFVRNYLESIQFNKMPPGPVLPPDVIEKTRLKYIEAYEAISGQKF